MQVSRWYVARATIALGLVAITAYACTDQNHPAAPVQPADPGATAVAPVKLAQLDCVASVSSKSVTCKEPSQGGESGVAKDVIYGGQNQYVVLTSSSVDYDSGTQKFTFNTTVRNLIPQAIGTTDGTSADGSGVKVFLSHDPVTTSGSGVVTVDNADGVGSFTGPNQAYYRYVGLLDQFDVSAPRLWRFNVPASVITFAFQLYVSSPVQFPYGWIEVSHPTYTLRRTYSKLITATVHDQLGHVIPGAVVTWSSADGSIATVTTDSGYVTGHLPGPVNIIATSTNSVPDSANATQTGAAHFTIAGTSLAWTAGAGTTAWSNGANWDRGVSPVLQDSITIPGSLGFYPVLSSNSSVSLITMADATTISLGAFDLTAAGSVASATTTGGITSSSGRLFLSGFASSVIGRVPIIRVNGVYSTTGNVTARAPIQVDAGRLTVNAAKLQADGN